MPSVQERKEIYHISCPGGDNNGGNFSCCGLLFSFRVGDLFLWCEVPLPDPDSRSGFIELEVRLFLVHVGRVTRNKLGVGYPIESKLARRHKQIRVSVNEKSELKSLTLQRKAELDVVLGLWLIIGFIIRRKA